MAASKIRDDDLKGLESRLAGTALGSGRQILSPRTFHRLFGAPKYAEEMATPRLRSKAHKKDADWTSDSIIQTPATSVAMSHSPLSVDIDKRDTARCQQLHKAFAERKDEELIIRQGGKIITTPKLKYIESYAESDITSTSGSVWTPLNKENLSPTTTTVSSIMTPATAITTTSSPLSTTQGEAMV